MLTLTESVRETSNIAALKKLLPQWIERVPLYQSAPYQNILPWLERAEAGWLAQLPFIGKAELRADFPHNFLGSAVDLETLVEAKMVEVEHTSGTSEDRTDLLLGVGWWAAQEQLALKLNHLVADIFNQPKGAKRVVINSPVCNNDIRYTTTPEYEDRIVGDGLFVSLSRHPFLWSEAELGRMAEEAAGWEPQFLDVDPVYAVVFARYCERNQIRFPSLKFILSSYEYLSVTHRRILERVFHVPVFNLYGATETGHLLMETETKRLVPSEQIAVLEIVEMDERGIGELVATTLTNEYMPLIRYRLGDLAERHLTGQQTHYILHGRKQESFMRGDGRRITLREIDECFIPAKGIAHYQLLHSADGAGQLRFVADRENPGEAELAELNQRLTALLGKAGELKMIATDLLMPEPSGKFRLHYSAPAK